MFAVLAFSFSGFFSAFWAFEQLHWQGQLALALTQLPSIIVALAPYPKAAGLAQTIFKILNLFSFLAHRDSPGTLKLPFKQSKPPTVVGSPVSSGAGAKGFVSLLLLPLLAVAALATLLLSPAARAQVIWSNPVVYAGPTAGVETMLNLKTGAITEIGAAGCFSLTLGVGSYEWLDRSWDVLDISGLACGASAGTGGASGSLQAGLKLGTLNGLIGIAALDPIQSAGGGYVPGGPSELALGVMVDVQGLIAIFNTSGTSARKMKLRLDGSEILPRGGIQLAP
jgi:hypothetical protein